MPIVPDPSTSIEAWGIYQAAKRVLGPTADYMGEGMKAWTEKRVNNVNRIFAKAEERLTGDQREKGAVPPKVIKAILDDGSFCDDELTASYFGGVLASSKTEIGRDDRGATLTSLVGRLSTYQVRTHYLIYAHAQRRLAGSTFNLGLDTDRNMHARVYLPLHVWANGMAFTQDESAMFGDIINDCIQGLLREDLIEVPFGFGSGQPLSTVGFPNAGTGLATQLSPLGIQLFVWSHGYNRSIYERFLDPGTDFTMSDAPFLQDGAKVLADVRAEAEAAKARPPAT